MGGDARNYSVDTTMLDVEAAFAEALKIVKGRVVSDER